VAVENSKLTRSQINTRKISLATANASCHASSDYRSQTRATTRRPKLSFPTTFPPEKNYFHNRRVPENSGNSLPNNNKIMQFIPTIQCLHLRKHSRPDGEVIKAIQSRFSSYSSASYRQTNDSINKISNERYPCTRRSAQKNFHAAITFATRSERKTQEGYNKNPSPIEKRSQI